MCQVALGVVIAALVALPAPYLGRREVRRGLWRVLFSLSLVVKNTCTAYLTGADVPSAEDTLPLLAGSLVDCRARLSEADAWTHGPLRRDTSGWQLVEDVELALDAVAMARGILDRPAVLSGAYSLPFAPAHWFETVYDDSPREGIPPPKFHDLLEACFASLQTYAAQGAGGQSLENSIKGVENEYFRLRQRRVARGVGGDDVPIDDTRRFHAFMWCVIWLSEVLKDIERAREGGVERAAAAEDGAIAVEDEGAELSHA
jgi:hypothetical protein